MNFTIAALCGLLIAFVYRKTYSGPGYAASYVNAIILLTVITAMVIMIIGNNLARAFGLVGAMSIIRFRTAVKETLDIVFIFFALAAGLAAGAGARMIAVVGTVFVGAVVFLLSRRVSAHEGRREYLLQITVDGEAAGAQVYATTLDRHCRQLRVVNIRSAGQGDPLELSYYIRLKTPGRNHELVRELKCIPGIDRVNLYYDDEQF
ncbi:MAG: DUF4956 domain-containing protein [Bacteroidota bacterium]|nr:DUF4956 domain-containing protein [Bacteroidota bacterium]